MQGADKYYNLFSGKSQQIGRLFFQFHTHARGKCFELFLLPEGVSVKSSTISGTKDAIEVYGMTGGQRGWTETYGWTHKGKWQDDFNDIIEQKELEVKASNIRRKIEVEANEAERKEKVNGLLSSY